MPFSTKQSDIFYNDETKEMFVCTVSAITAYRCESSDIVYGALPIVYKIDKDTNFKKTIYPPDISTFETNSASDVYKLTPQCAYDDLNFDSITKPLINFNKSTSRYSVTFLGRFESDVDGLVINNYIFENIDNRFHLINAKSLLPQNSLSAVNGRFTFDSGYLNSDLYVGGNSVRNHNFSWFNPDGDEEIERSPNYMIGPTHVESTSALGFNLIQANSDTASDALTGNLNYPIMYNGGYINVNPKYAAFDPKHTIRIDFRARSFNATKAGTSETGPTTAYGHTQSTGTSATRWIQQYAPNGPGSGFCVYLYKQPAVSGTYVVPNGVGSTLGYSPADFNTVEVVGASHSTVGLFERDYWSPIGTKDSTKYGYYGNIGDGRPADSFLGVGFDIGGNFASTSEDKPGWYDGTTYTATPCSVAVRGNRFTNNKVLTAVELATIPGATNIPLHTSAHDAVFVDYRIDLTNKGNRLTVSHKLTSNSTYNTILDLRLNKIQGTGAGNEYNPWKGFDVDVTNGEYPLLNVGLSFTTGSNCSEFELHSFEVKGVKVHNPWEVKIKDTDSEKTTSGKERFDYINKSSENLRKRIMNVSSDEEVDVELFNIPAKKDIANDIYQQTNTTEITLCDDNNPDIVEDEIEIDYKGIDPGKVDKIKRAVERGELVPQIGGDPIPRVQDRNKKTTYTPTPSNDKVDIKDVSDPILPSRFIKACRTAGKANEYPQFWLYQSEPFKYKNREYVIFIRGMEHQTFGNQNTLKLYETYKRTLEDKWVAEIAKSSDVEKVKYWELHLINPDHGLGIRGHWNSDSRYDYPYIVDKEGNLNWYWSGKSDLVTQTDVDNWLTKRHRGAFPDTICIKLPQSQGSTSGNNEPEVTESKPKSITIVGVDPNLTDDEDGDQGLVVTGNVQITTNTGGGIDTNIGEYTGLLGDTGDPITQVNLPAYLDPDAVIAEEITLPRAKSMTTSAAFTFWKNVRYDGNQLKTFFQHPGSSGTWYAIPGNVVREIEMMGGGG